MDDLPSRMSTVDSKSHRTSIILSILGFIRLATNAMVSVLPWLTGTQNVNGWSRAPYLGLGGTLDLRRRTLSSDLRSTESATEPSCGGLTPSFSLPMTMTRVCASISSTSSSSSSTRRLEENTTLLVAVTNLSVISKVSRRRSAWGCLLLSVCTFVMLTLSIMGLRKRCTSSNALQLALCLSSDAQTSTPSRATLFSSSMACASASVPPTSARNSKSWSCLCEKRMRSFVFSTVLISCIGVGPRHPMDRVAGLSVMSDME
mmetsp:Transcript_9290/g.32278  ORF Transcript_9290/g.32278 Transcript_9290/m.32278 type:complete len:260 (+) Transcript_9290:312-1091(+)